jgi:hypothetical protein
MVMILNTVVVLSLRSSSPMLEVLIEPRKPVNSKVIGNHY